MSTMLNRDSLKWKQIVEKRKNAPTWLSFNGDTGFWFKSWKHMETPLKHTGSCWGSCRTSHCLPFNPPTSFLQIKGKMLNLTGVHIGSVHYAEITEDFLIHLAPYNPPEYLVCVFKMFPATFYQLNAAKWLENPDTTFMCQLSKKQPALYNK